LNGESASLRSCFRVNGFSAGALTARADFRAIRASHFATFAQTRRGFEFPIGKIAPHRVQATRGIQANPPAL
jgi:hypothetical protein